MIASLGVIMFLGGLWVCAQSTETKFGPAVAVGGAVILLVSWLS